MSGSGRNKVILGGASNMIWKFVGAAIVLPSAIAMGGCATGPVTPETCTMNYTATGAMVGAAAGAAAGVAIAAIANAAGSVFGVAALGGALIGGIAGAIIGNQRDKACHDMALKMALDQAAAEVARERQAAADAASARASQTAAASRRAPAAEPAAYQTVAWANRMTNNSGSITPLGVAADTPTDAICLTYVDQQIVGGKSESVTSKACRAPDGEWKPVS
jgi:surface antigen